MMLQIRNLRYTVSDMPDGKRGAADRDKDILDGIDLDIDAGTLTVVTGPNGGGKSTLAKAVMGLVRPDSGSILFEGRDIMPLGVTERARLGISYGFQQPPRFKGIKVRDLIEIASGRDDLSTADCCRYLNKVGLCAGDYIDREVDTALSGGEVKRIEIATVLARGAKLMIFDEPEAGIDLWSFARLTETFSELHRKSDAAIVIISHQERIMNIADSIAVLAGGRIEKYGRRDEIFPSILSGSGNYCDYLKEDCGK